MMSRQAVFLLTFAATLITSPASSASAIVTPQSGGGSGGGSSSASAVRTRTRCSSCATSRESERKAREKLLMKIDSLRWEIDNRRLTESERERASREMTRTILALQQSLDVSMRMDAALASKIEMDAHETMRMSPAVVTVEVGYRSRGYLGVTFDGPSAEINRPNDFSIRFYQYPRIALVEPSSPAERAGVLQGDTLLALNGADVIENEISLTKLLIPESRIVMRVRRGGGSKDLKVTVGEAPDYYVRRGAAPVVARARTPGVMPVEPVRVWSAEATTPMAPMAPMPPMPAQSAVWVPYDGVAGARVETISEGLGKAVGAKVGVLVLRVVPGSPAYRSGLRDGDVILSAAGTSISSVRILRGIVAEGDGDEGVKLVILRERKERDLTLRW